RIDRTREAGGHGRRLEGFSLLPGRRDQRHRSASHDRRRQSRFRPHIAPRREVRILMRTAYWNIAALGLAAVATQAAEHQLKATPETVVVGYYWSEAKPVLKIQSGDTVAIETVSGSASRLVALGVPQDQIPPAIEAIRKAPIERGPGGHTLTGPVYVEGAEPGDVLEVRIRKIVMPVPWAMNSFRPTTGFLQEDFPYSR